MEEDDFPENPLLSLQYHTLVVLGTEDYVSARALEDELGDVLEEMREARSKPEGDDTKVKPQTFLEANQSNDDGTIIINGHEYEISAPPSTDVDNSLDTNTKFIRKNLNHNEDSNALKEPPIVEGLSRKDNSDEREEEETIKVIGDREKKSTTQNFEEAPSGLEYCSSPVPYLIGHTGTRNSLTPKPIAFSHSNVKSQTAVAQTSALEYSSSPVIFPFVSPGSSLTGSQCGSSLVSSWSTSVSSESPFVSSNPTFSADVRNQWHKNFALLTSLPLYTHDKVPIPVPVSGTPMGLGRVSSPDSRSYLSECISSCSEKTLVGYKTDSVRIFGSGTDSESLPTDIIDSSPVYENPSEFDSEYYYKSPKGK